MRHRSLIPLRSGVWVHADDPLVDAKRMQYGGYRPWSPLTEARHWAALGHVRLAKQLCENMLQVRESWEVHELLASLCSEHEALERARRSAHPQVQRLYYTRALSLNPRNAGAQRALQALPNLMERGRERLNLSGVHGLAVGAAWASGRGAPAGLCGGDGSGRTGRRSGRRFCWFAWGVLAGAAMVGIGGWTVARYGFHWAGWQTVQTTVY
ncbi:MAG: hypothetical protein K6T26_06755, partial [Alicyclobacillus sp.]|nr:hypothetical protein [Alicyclobacillus sp.]